MGEWDVVSSTPAATDPWAVADQKPTDPYAGQSFGTRVVNDLKGIGNAAKRAALLGAKGFNDTVARTAALPADAAVEGYNLVTGKNVQTMGDWWQQKSDADVAPPQNIPETMISAVSSGLTGFKAPFPGNGLGRPPSSVQQSLSAARGSGYKVLPSEVPDSSRVLRAAEHLAGSKQTAAAITDKNVARMSENIAGQLGMPKGTEINPDTLEAVIRESGKDYGVIAQKGKWYADKIEVIKEKRNLASKYYKQSATTYSVDAEQKAESLRAEADALDNKIEGALKATGRSELMDNYVASRKRIAQAYDAMKSLVKSRGELDPKTFSTKFGKDAPLSGEMLAAGRSAEAFPSSFLTNQPTGLGKFNNLDSWLLTSGVGMYELAHNPKMAAAAVGAAGARGLGRRALMSNTVQDYLLLTPEQRKAALASAVLKGGVGSKGLGQ